MTDIAKLLSQPDKPPMSQQQASQIVDRDDFPTAVAAPSGRRVWTRKSVEAFARRWPRIAGWAGKHAATQ